MSDILERQKIISHLDENLIVSASAGSGKTTILVERMVALVESGKFKLSKIAALTFTKKAAGEFYERFYKKLQLRTKPGFDVKTHDEYSLLQNPTADGVRRDKEALAQIDTCFFGTIDAFYQKILNEHPLEAELSCNTQVIDNEDIGPYLIKKFNEYINSKDPNLREKAEFFAQHVGAQHFPTMMTEILNNKSLDLDQLPDSLQTLETSYSQLLDDFKKGCEVLESNSAIFIPNDDRSGTGRTAKNLEKWDNLKSAIGQIRVLKDNDYKNAEYIFKSIEDLRFDKDVNNQLTPYNFIGTYASKYQTDKGVFRYYEIKNPLFSFIRKIKFIRVVNFLKEVREDIYQSMIDAGQLTFALTTDCLLKLLRNDKDYKPVIDQIKDKIDCLLIDECQDTDLKQYEIFFRLVSSDYKPNFEDLTIDGGKLYACGDRKQGIYHFRGADVTVYDYIKDLFAKKKANKLPFDLITLTDNYRSQDNLLDYFNKTFKNLLAGQGYDPITNGNGLNPTSDYGAYSYKTTKDTDPDQVSKIVLDLHNNKNIAYKDFMIITTSKPNITNYSRAFARASIPCYCEGRIDIHVSPLLDVVIGLFKYLSSNKTDTIALLEVLSSPLFNFDITKSIDLSIDYLGQLGIPQNKTLMPSDMLEILASNIKVLEALNCKGIDVLIGFIHLLKEAENTGEIVSYGDAVKYFTDLQAQDKVIERLSLLANNIDAVQIANSHKTKGLEKDVVILTNGHYTPKTVAFVEKDKFYIANWSIRNGEKTTPLLTNPNADVDPVKTLVDAEKDYEKEEKLRLLYVAATRARKYLFISDTIGKNDKRDTQNWWFQLIDGNANVKPYTINQTCTANINSVNLVITPKNISFNGTKANNFVAPSKEDGYSITDPDLAFNSQIQRSDALVFGSMVHKLMEYIVKAKNIMLDDSICDNVASLFGRADLKDDLLKVKTSIYNGGFVQKKCPFKDIVDIAKQCICYTEVPISYKNGNNIVTGNIDLVLEQNNKVIIIDYKTDINEIDHSNQLNYYKEAINKNTQFNGKEIEAYIYSIQK